MNSNNPYESPRIETGSDLPETKTKEFPQRSIVSMIGLVFGAGVGGVIGVILAVWILVVRGKPLLNDRQVFFWAAATILILMAGGVLGGLIGRKLRFVKRDREKEKRGRDLIREILDQRRG